MTSHPGTGLNWTAPFSNVPVEYAAVLQASDRDGILREWMKNSPERVIRSLGRMPSDHPRMLGAIGVL
jgi:hypothetical protein